ncbi:hypothetical protein HN51_017531 [Arachis hypogaea]
MTSNFDRWEKDPFFEAAEEVQESADRLESAYRTWIRSTKDDSSVWNSDELRRDLNTALGTAKWQLDEFNRAVKSSYSRSSIEDTRNRHRDFVAAIDEKITKVEYSLYESDQSGGEAPRPWAHLDEGEQDELALFLSGMPATGNPRLVDTNSVSNCSKNAHALSGLGEAKEDRLNAHRRAASASADIGSWKIAVSDDAQQWSSSSGSSGPMPKVASLSAFLSSMGSVPVLKWPRNGYRKLNHQEPDNALLPMTELKKGNKASFEKSKSCLESSDESYDKQLYGWYGAIQRQIRRSQYQMRYSQPVRITVSIVVLLCLIAGVENPQEEQELANCRSKKNQSNMSDLQWKKVEVLGAGSYGTVSLAILVDEQNRFHSFIAVKSSIPRLAFSLEKEEQIFKSLWEGESGGCQEIIECFGTEITVEHGHQFYNLFLEYAPYGSLADLIHKKPLPETEVSVYARMIVKGLSHIHRKGIVHCDLKPENILVFPSLDKEIANYQLKIADFGLSKTKEEKADVELWKSKPRGTPSYLSPEAFSGHIDAPMDIWALGCIVIEMLTGLPAWGESPLLIEELRYLVEHHELSPRKPQGIDDPFLFMTSNFDRWEKDPFFEAAEEVQESADRLESAYRTWIRSTKDDSSVWNSDELRRDLNTALGTAKWQLDEFNRAVKSSYSRSSIEDTRNRHRDFVAAIDEKITKVEYSLYESDQSGGEAPRPWAHLDEGEQDELALFLSGMPATGNPRLVDTNSVSNCSKNAHALSGLGEAKEDRLNAHRRAASASADIGSWKIAVSDDAQQWSSSSGSSGPMPKVASLSAFLSSMGSVPVLKWPRNGYRKLNHKEPDNALLPMTELKKNSLQN